MNLQEIILSAFLGHAIGDALGVPVEFKSRKYLSENPVKDYLGYMCWNQPSGTFSDDSSMMFCTAESLTNGYNLNDIGQLFVKWYKTGYWGAHNELFDIGGTTRRSLDRIHKGLDADFSGDFFAENNGNGSLMRILPMVFFLKNEKNVEVRYKLIKEVSSITHAHLRSVLSCFIFVEFGIELIKTSDKFKSYKSMQKTVNEFVRDQEFNTEEIALFDRVLKDNVSMINIADINSTGYVLDSLESSLWCFMNSDSFSESILKSVNLGGDTDTTAAINGGLAGIYYGINRIPSKWILGIAKNDEIKKLSTRFYKSLNPV